MLRRLLTSRALAISISSLLIFNADAMAQAAGCTCCPGSVPTDPVISYPLGDQNSDGIAELIAAAPFAHGLTGDVAILSGVTGNPIRIFHSRPSDIAFGISVLPLEDATGDGLEDVAIGLLRPFGPNDVRGMILVASVQTGRFHWIVANDAAPGAQAQLSVRQITDVNGSGVVDFEDVLLVAEVIFDPPTDPLPTADVNLDGVIDELDLVEIVEEVGIVQVPDSVLDLMSSLSVDPPLYMDQNFSGTIGTPIDELGLIGCLWCVLKCGKALADAADCVDGANEWLNNCLEDACGDIWAEIECWEGRITNIQTCLADIAAAAPQCARCITKCGPSAG